jgi:hypothetical protein
MMTIVLSFVLTVYQKVFSISVPFDIVVPVIFFIFNDIHIKRVQHHEIIPLPVILPLVYTFVQLIHSVATFGLSTATNNARYALLIWCTIVAFYFMSRKQSEEQVYKRLKFSLFCYSGYAALIFILALSGLIDSIGGVYEINRYISSEEALLFGICSVFVLNAVLNGIRKEFINHAAFLCLFAGAIFTYHRSVWIATLSGYVTLLFLKKRSVLPSVIAICLLIGAMIVLMPSKVKENFSVSLNNIINDEQGNTASWRVEGWSQLIETVITRSLVTGMGFGASKTRVIDHHGTLIEWNVSAHNQYVDQLFVGGLSGLSIEIFFLLNVCARCIHFAVSSKNTYASVLFSVLIVYIAYHWSYSARTPFGIIIGLITAIVYRSNALPIPKSEIVKCA